jgi:hypothetical protein
MRDWGDMLREMNRFERLQTRDATSLNGTAIPARELLPFYEPTLSALFD